MTATDLHTDCPFDPSNTPECWVFCWHIFFSVIPFIKYFILMVSLNTLKNSWRDRKELRWGREIICNFSKVKFLRKMGGEYNHETNKQTNKLTQTNKKTFLKLSQTEGNSTATLVNNCLLPTSEPQSWWRTRTSSIKATFVKTLTVPM